MTPFTTHRILPFPTTRVDTIALTRAKFRQHDLLELVPPGDASPGDASPGDASPAGLGGASQLICGENILLPAANQPRHRYACCAYVVSADGRKAVPVIGCRAWFHAPLPANTSTHPVWEDLGGGLLEAAHRLDDATFDLNGAIVAARSWLVRRHEEVAARAGSALLVGYDSHVFCAAAPASPPPHDAKAYTVPFEPVTVWPMPRRQSLRLSA